jgi:integrase
MTVMINMGLRVSEVSNLKPGNINLTEYKLRIVNGKGGVDRDILFLHIKRWPGEHSLYPPCG